MKIGAIIKREYLTHVKKRSFIIGTILGPIIMAALMVLPSLLMLHSDEFASKKTIVVLDETGLFTGKFEDTDSHIFVYRDTASLDELKDLVDKEIFDAVVYVPATTQSVPVNAKIYSKDYVPTTISSHVKTMMKKEVEHQKLLAMNIDPEVIKSIDTNINVATVMINKDEEHESFFGLMAAIGIILGLIIYFAILLFGQKVMRGVVEERNNRIVEVLVSSVRPFDLMMGKIVGIALVGLTQFVLWIVLTLLLYFVFAMTTLPTTQLVDGAAVEQVVADASTQQAISSVSEIISSIDFGTIIFAFIAFFIGGYFLYASLFAAVGSFSDSESDNQQFVVIVTAPLILSMLLFSVITAAPDSSMSLWFSMIPFTSPIAMLIRVPFGVPIWQIVVSLLILYGSFFLFTWISAKIYRTGILMYGKKMTWKELWKWIRQ